MMPQRANPAINFMCLEDMANGGKVVDSVAVFGPKNPPLGTLIFPCRMAWPTPIAGWWGTAGGLYIQFPANYGPQCRPGGTDLFLFWIRIPGMVFAAEFAAITVCANWWRFGKGVCMSLAGRT